MKTSKLSQRCLQNSESEAQRQCESAGSSKAPATGILHSDYWCLFFFYFVCFYRYYLWKFIIPYPGRGAADENAGLPDSRILTKY